MKFYVKSKNVKELSPKNFNIVDITKRKININNNNTNHLIKFYAHWCPHCHNPDLKNMLEALGKKLKEYNIQVSAFNCAENTEHGDLSEYLGVESYPTIMYKDKNSNKFVKFNGNRDLKSIVEFLVKNKK